MAHAMACDSPKGKHKACRVLVEADDNYFAVAPSMKRTGWSKRMGESMHTLEGHAAIVRHADACIVTTDTLASFYRKHNPNVYVCPNAVEPDDWPLVGALVSVQITRAEQRQQRMLAKLAAAAAAEQASGQVLGAVLNRRTNYIPEFLYKLL